MSTIDLQQAVVLLLDCEEGVAARVFPEGAGRQEFARAAGSLLAFAQRAGIPVVRVDVAFRDGYVDVAPSNAYFSGVKAAGRLLESSQETGPMRELAQAVADAPRVVKRRIGAFASDLEWVLRGLGRSQLLLAGLITRGAVLSTACQAADLDYRVVVVADACADTDAEVHRTLVGSVLPLRGQVVSLAQLTEQPT